MTAKKPATPKLPRYHSSLPVRLQLWDDEALGMVATWLAHVQSGDGSDSQGYHETAFEYFGPLRDNKSIAEGRKRQMAAMVLEATLRGVAYWRERDRGRQLDVFCTSMGSVSCLFDDQLKTLFGPKAADCISLHDQIDDVLPTTTEIVTFVDRCALNCDYANGSEFKNLSGAVMNLGNREYLLFGRTPSDNPFDGPPAVYWRMGDDGVAAVSALGDDCTPAYTTATLRQIPQRSIDLITHDFNGTRPLPTYTARNVFAVIYGGQR